MRRRRGRLKGTKLAKRGEAQLNAKSEVLQTVGSVVYDASMDNSVQTRVNGGGENVEMTP